MLLSHGLFRRLAVVFLMLFSLSAILPLAASAQGNSEAARSCQGEGYLEYTDADGNAFTNAGQCTRYAAQGNTLAPVVVTDPGGGTDPVVGASFTAVAVQTDADGGLITYSGSGLEPRSTVTERLYLVVESRPGLGDTHVEFDIGTADANGDFFLITGFRCDTSIISRTVIGVTPDGTVVSATVSHPC